MDITPLTQNEIEDLFFNSISGSKMKKSDQIKRRKMESELKRIGCYYDMGLMWEYFLKELEKGNVKTHEAITIVVKNHSGKNNGVKIDFLRMLVRYFREKGIEKST